MPEDRGVVCNSLSSRRSRRSAPAGNRYVSPDEADLERVWHVGAHDHWRVGSIFPRKLGPCIRAGANGGRELVVGQWGLIPFFAKTPKLTYQTNNARSEELAVKATFRDPWKRGQRCIIPAQSFEEPNWESGKNQWWRFRRADGRAWGLAGLWSTWADTSTGEIVESYTMILGVTTDTWGSPAQQNCRTMTVEQPSLPGGAPDVQQRNRGGRGISDSRLGRHSAL